MNATPSLWRQVQRNNFTCLNKLCTFLELSPSQREELLESPKFSLNLPQRLAQKINKGTLDDPILRQFLPFKLEQVSRENFAKDPVGDSKAALTARCLKKYSGRVLLLTTGACAMHCRFCFRQNYPYETHKTHFEHELNLIKGDPTIKEVILSGGDPLSLSDTALKELLEALSTIAHVKRVRFHTRFPIGIPERIDEPFLQMLAHIPLQFWMVIHCNHPQELDDDILYALKSLQKIGIPVLNQSVLLKDINDNIETLQRLYENLIDQGILPYYLHQLDRVAGASHFEVPEEKGIQLINELNRLIAGYGVPKYVKEIACETSKIPIL